MIERRNVPRGSLDAALCQNTSICSYESEVVRGLYYGIKNNIFAVMRDGDAYRCPVREVPKLAEMAKLKALKNEMLEIYEDAIYFSMDKHERKFTI